MIYIRGFCPGQRKLIRGAAPDPGRGTFEKVPLHPQNFQQLRREIAKIPVKVTNALDVLDLNRISFSLIV